MFSKRLNSYKVGIEMVIKRYETGGGVVVHEGKVLLLDRPKRGEVRLPKGHIDPGETPEMTALRETTEESMPICRSSPIWVVNWSSLTMKTYTIFGMNIIS